MKQLLVFLLFTFVLASCSDDKSETSSKDSTSSVEQNIDTTLPSANKAPHDGYYGSNDHYYEALNKEGTTTLVTSETQIYVDSLLIEASILTLSEGEEITIEQLCGTINHGNWAEPVYKISHKNGDDIFYGYLSQSRIACLQHTLKSKTIVLMTLDYNQSSDKFIGEIMLMNASRQILGSAVIDFDIYKGDQSPYSFYYYLSILEIERSVGLDGIIESFYISAGYDACGYPHITNIFLWNGQKLIVAPETYYVSDSGVFYAGSQLHFPSDSLGRLGYIVKTFEVEEKIEGPESTFEYYNKDSVVVLYKWNKNSYSKGDTILKTSKQITYPITND